MMAASFVLLLLLLFPEDEDIMDKAFPKMVCLLLIKRSVVRKEARQQSSASI
jgi:hypothetical protein